MRRGKAVPQTCAEQALLRSMPGSRWRQAAHSKLDGSVRDEQQRGFDSSIEAREAFFADYPQQGGHGATVSHVSGSGSAGRSGSGATRRLHRLQLHAGLGDPERIR